MRGRRQSSHRKVCRKCRIFVEGDKCPICGGTDFTTTWAGIAIILNPDASEVAKAMEVNYPGKYAIEVR